MESVPTLHDQPSGAPEGAILHPQERMPAMSESVRKCLATGEELSKDDLVRFVVGPDASVVPDLAQNLPGRGLWVKAERDAIALAAKKNLFARAAKASVKVSADLADQVAGLLRKRCLDFMGLARGAGLAVLGQTQVEAASRAGKLALILIADDAKDAPDNRHQVTEYQNFTRNELGAIFGHDQIVYAGFLPHGLTHKLKRELSRLENISASHLISQVKDNVGL